MTVRHPYAFRLHPRMRQGLHTEVPLPTRLVSNEEFPPLPQTAAQREVEERILTEAGRLAPRLGLSRRDFLRTSGGMATALLAMNAVFGRFFDVLAVEAADPAAFQARTGEAFFIFDVQLHYVGAGYDPSNAEAGRQGAVTKQGLLGLRQQARRLNPQLATDRGTLADLSWANFVKEVFLDSETAIGLISTPPGPYPQEAVVPPKEMTHIRDEINRITQSRRMLAHGLVTPQLGQADLDFMELQASTLKVDAWKAYTGAAPKGFDRGWFLDDERIAYPMLESPGTWGAAPVRTQGPAARACRGLQPSARPDQGGEGFPGHRFPRVPRRVAQCRERASVGGGTLDHRVLPEEAAGARPHEYLHGVGVHLRAARHDQSHGLRPPARAGHRGLWGRPCAVGDGLDLVRDTAVANRSVPAL